MSMVQRSKVQTRDYEGTTIFEPAEDDVLADTIYSDDMVSQSYKGLAPRSSSNYDHIQALQALQQDPDAPVFDDDNSTTVSPSVAYIDMDGLIEDDELYLGSLPDGKDGDEDPGEYQKRVQKALRDHVEHAMDDGTKYDAQYDANVNPKLDPTNTEEYDPKFAAEVAAKQAKGEIDSDFGDEVNEVDQADSSQLKRQLNKYGVDTTLYERDPDAVVKMRELLRSKILMDFSGSEQDGVIDEADADALQEQFANGTILVKDSKETREQEEDDNNPRTTEGTKSVIENYVVAGQVDSQGKAQTLSSVDALELAHATLQNYEGIPEETHLDQIWDDYILNEAEQASIEGKSDLYKKPGTPP